jgi:molybdopterin molybdotransferase
MGAFDIVKDALSEIGTVEFTRVAMQPGRPQGFGHLGNKVPIFCLPGNPVSSLVSFEAFVRPAIRKLLGKRNLQRATVQATALEGAKSAAGIRQYRRGVLHRETSGGYSVSLMGGSGAHRIASLALSNCLVVIDEDVTTVQAGSDVTVLPLLLSNR